MALRDFFRINLPYGITKNANGEWIAFNREYMPLGWNDISNKNDNDSADGAYSEFPIFTQYKGLTEKKLLSIAGTEESVQRNDKGEIDRIWLYNDKTNPQNNIKYRNDYFEKIWALSKLEVARQL